MTDLQEINIGSAPDDGTGDPLRTAFDKINDNFAELNADITFTTTYKGHAPVISRCSRLGFMALEQFGGRHMPLLG